MTHSVQLMRDKFFSTRTVICTGNPNKNTTIASGVKKIWPDATFLCRSTGWDLESCSEFDLAEEFKRHNTFINASNIKPGVQKKLLDICHNNCRFFDVVNIGSMYELRDERKDQYTISKIELKNTSLAYNSFRFQTTHIILGGIQCDQHPEWLTPDEIASSIQWTLSQRYKIPIVSITQPLAPW